MILAYAITAVSVAPLRAEPSQRSEQVSQLLFGEKMEVSAKEGHWLQVRGCWDDYEGWIIENQVVLLTEKTFKRKATSMSAGIGDTIHVGDGITPLSPGSELFQMRRREMLFGERHFTFKGKRQRLKDALFSEAGLQHWSTLFLGAPYHWGGRSIMGIDCSGFSQVVFKLMGKRLPRDARDQAQTGETIDFLSNGQCGDLAFFDNEAGCITHVGILLDNRNIIHATESAGCVVIDALDNEGIVSRLKKQRTHRLRLIKRYF